ncbi:MAG: TetR/AcrR family transcriptional regulator; helix-turn-helix transcriptional regulator [Kangiellaceae bacterium]|nr:TetR/AcrR family transcriptional regulator; helix-turn-helix transcriptional regulator [Kangiellaceae bacterium]
MTSFQIKSKSLTKNSDESSSEVGRPRSTQVNTSILESASRLVSELGYQATSIEKVAANAGVGKASIYRRWKSKAAMMIEVYRWQIPAELLISKSDSFDYRMKFLLRKLFDAYRNSAAGYILIGLIADSQSNEATKRELKSGIIQQRRKFLTEVIELGIQDRSLSAGCDVQEANDLVVAMIWHQLLIDKDKLNLSFTKRIMRILASL